MKIEQAKLEILRKSKGLTQKDLADVLGFTRRTYINKIKGSTEFTATEMFKLSRYFNMNIEDIFSPPTHQIGELNTESDLV